MEQWYFSFKSTIFLDEIKKFSPSLLKTCMESIKDESYDMDFQRINSEVFMNCENISIDKAVMEKTSKGLVIPLSTKWSDLEIGNQFGGIQQKILIIIPH